MVQKFKLNTNSQDALQESTPHGILRTMLRPSKTDNATDAVLSVQYDERQLLFVLATGTHADAVADGLIERVWDDFPTASTNASAFASPIHDYLQGDARNLGNDNTPHGFVVGAQSREVATGRTWLAWLGTSGIQVLDRNTDALAIVKGIQAGESWSPEHGISPDGNTVHGELLTTNALSRIVVFTNALRPMIDELPYLGRTTIQRIADAQTSDVPAIFLDLKTFPVLPTPEEVSVFYRWENATQATLFWVGGEKATGYRIEQATTADFDDVSLLAELTDARQRIYTVQPSPEQTTFYRVVPLSESIPGVPSQPVIVTPVPLVAPIIESIEWRDEGGISITWTNIPQANYYELESSPDPDFDSPETAIVYRGDSFGHETPAGFPTGWYFRVRSMNTHFAPHTPSFWSIGRRAPVQLDTPQFQAILPSELIWNYVSAARSYEVRKFSNQNASEPETVAVTQTRLSIKEKDVALYQVRAMLEPGDEVSASAWSLPAAVGGWSGDIDAAIFTEAADITGGSTMEVPKPMPPQADLGLASDATTPLTGTPMPGVPQTGDVGPLPAQAWQWIIVAAAVALGLGLLVGLIGGPRFGIGLDPTNTPLTNADREATSVQSTLLWNNSDDLERLIVNATEEKRTGSIQIASLESQNADANATIDAARATQEVVAADLNDLQDMATADVESASMERTALAVDIADLNDQNDALNSDISNAQATQTAVSQQLTDLQEVATQDAENAAATQVALDESITDLDATITSAEIAEAELLTELENLQGSATTSADEAASSAEILSETIEARENAIDGLNADIDSAAATQSMLNDELSNLQQTATLDAQSAAETNSALNEQIEALTNEKTSLEEARDGLTLDLTNLQATATADAQSAADNATMLNAQITALQAEIDVLTEEKAALEVERDLLTSQNVLLSDNVAAAEQLATDAAATYAVDQENLQSTIRALVTDTPTPTPSPSPTPEPTSTEENDADDDETLYEISVLFGRY